MKGGESRDSPQGHAPGQLNPVSPSHHPPHRAAPEAEPVSAPLLVAYEHRWRGGNSQHSVNRADACRTVRLAVELYEAFVPTGWPELKAAGMQVYPTATVDVTEGTECERKSSDWQEWRVNPIETAFIRQMNTNLPNAELLILWMWLQFVMNYHDSAIHIPLDVSFEMVSHFLVEACLVKPESPFLQLLNNMTKETVKDQATAEQVV